MLRRTEIALLAVVLLVAGAGLALADPPEEDTLFNFGYDPEGHVLLWNTSGLEGLYDCGLENGKLTATYGDPSEQGVIPVDNLEDDEGVVSFRARLAEELPEGVDPAEDPIDYAGADGECGLSGAEVAGPQGQINHGMFMRLFNSLYEGTGGRGCLNRHLARSPLGKDDQQIRVPDVDPDFVSVAAGDSGEVEFTTVSTACEPGRGGGNGNGNGNGNGTGAEQTRGRPDSPGRSASAPGRAGR